MAEIMSRAPQAGTHLCVSPDFLQIDAITGDIIFFYELAVPDHISLTAREKEAFFCLLGATVEEETSAWWHQVHK